MATAIPVLSAVRLGTLTPLLVLALAILWRWRDRRWVAGGSLAVAISLKLFLWPLVVWLLLTRRFRAALCAAGSAATLVIGACEPTLEQQPCLERPLPYGGFGAAHRACFAPVITDG